MEVDRCCPERRAVPWGVQSMLKRRSSSVRIAVLMGGDSAEREISLKTGHSICEALGRRGYRPVPIDVGEDLPVQLKQKKIQVAFLALHGPGGEDGTVQGLLEVMNIPYTGSGVSASAVGMDKGLSRVVLKAEGIPVPPGRIIRNQHLPLRPFRELGLPVVVKPCLQGSTIGVSIVRKHSEWRKALMKAYRYGDEAIIEKFIPGREVAVSIFENTTYPIVEVVAPKGFYDFSAKYGQAPTRYICPADLSSRLKSVLREHSLRSYEALGCQGAARVDFRIHKNGRPYVLELNTIPGMTERSLLPMAASQAGISYDELVERILINALPQPGKSTRSGKSTQQRRKK